MKEGQVKRIILNEFEKSFFKVVFSNIDQLTCEQLRFLNASKCVISKVIALDDL